MLKLIVWTLAGAAVFAAAPALAGKKPARTELSLTVSSAAQIAEGETVTWTVEVVNSSRTPARRVRLLGVDTLASYCTSAAGPCPIGTSSVTHFLAFEPSQGRCATEQAGFDCSLGTIASFSTVTVTVLAQPRVIVCRAPCNAIWVGHPSPAPNGQVTTWNASVWTTTTERDYHDNSAQASVVVIPRAP